MLYLLHVNSCISKIKATFEGTVEELAFAKKSNYMLKLDLTNG